ncbi:heme exporter protein CcmB [Maritalea sp. S77]|uniref:heme exporter protein CcmB n=1 Tax=Maritalea sp. S77 TaxID=3415125 RepID=UPI003C7A2D19
MKPFLAVLTRDMKLATRIGGDSLTVLLFYIMTGAIMPFAIGPDKDQLAQLGPAIIWISALLSLLLALDRLFRMDHEDGSLLAMRQASLPLEMIVVAKICAHWVTTALPLIVATPILAILLNLEIDQTLRVIFTLLVGTPALICFGAIGAAVTVSIKRGGLIAPILILPLSIPTLIFGVSAVSSGAIANAQDAALLFLAGFTLLSLVFTPFAAALALKMAAE